METNTTVPEKEWTEIHDLVDKIMRRSWEQEKDITNLNNLIHALHGEGIRDPRYRDDGRPATFENGKWVPR